MTEKVEVKVSDNHIKHSFPVGESEPTKDESVVVEKNPTVEAGIESGALEVVETFQENEDDEQEQEQEQEAVQEAESGGEESEEDDGETGGQEPEQVEDDSSEDEKEDEEEVEEAAVDDYEYTELQERASEYDDVSGNAPKEELFNQLREKGEV